MKKGSLHPANAPFLGAERAVVFRKPDAEKWRVAMGDPIQMPQV
jgi:hypothetical protein